PMAAFRPCRCQQRPCQSVLLPPDRGVLTKSGVHSMLGTHNKRIGYPLEISGGLEVTKRFIDEGEYVVRDDLYGIISTGNLWERNYTYGVSIGLRYIAELGIGYKTDFITSHLGSNFPNSGNDRNARAYDWGILLRLPINNALKEVYNINTQRLIDPFTIDIIPSFGYSNSNLGDNKVYGQPLPEINRRGYALEFRIDLPVVPLLAFIYTQDFNDIRYDIPSGDNDIRYDIPSGDNGYKTGGVGREFSFFDSFVYRWGNYYDTEGHLFKSTTGYSLQSKGILKIIHLATQDQEWAEGELYNFVMNRLNFKYSRSFWKAGSNYDISDSAWIELGISF
ncbi:MAG: hypothetical protein RAP03_03115, partial [Candidatus Electryonea clarkiae]|nr:hypothetical protein [Candidatus Electryonea clarkiae]